MLIRRAWNLWGRHLGDAATFAGRVMDAVTESAARHTFLAALADTEIAPDGIPGAGAAPLIDAAIGARPVFPAVRAGLQLNWPLVAIGAPSPTYGEGIARRLGTRLILPPHGDVANAVGAVVAGVVQRVTATITPLADDRYRVHTSHGVSTFATLDAARDWAALEAERLARTHAEAAGATEVEIELERQDVVGRGGDGHEVFFEGRVTATARGRPLAGP